MSVLPDKVTLTQITSLIMHEEYYVFPNTTVTTCLLRLMNGTHVVGVNYGAIRPADHSFEEGKKMARAAAVNQIWEKENYLLRECIWREQQQESTT